MYLIWTMRLRTILSLMFVLFFISCSSTLRVVERYPSNQKKVEEVISGKDNRLKIKKRINDKNLFFNILVLYIFIEWIKKQFGLQVVAQELVKL